MMSPLLVAFVDCIPPLSPSNFIVEIIEIEMVLNVSCLNLDPSDPSPSFAAYPMLSYVIPLMSGIPFSQLPLFSTSSLQTAVTRRLRTALLFRDLRCASGALDGSVRIGKIIFQSQVFGGLSIFRVRN